MAYVEPLHWMVWGTLGLLILFTPPVLYLSASLLLGGTLVFWHWEAMLISYLATRVIVLPFESLQGMTILY
ncbi:hypothetical protein TCAL_16114 [Tigriopus californicus]|uniref:Uncharacterized protein n=1 Tax=Tigriopus californicus TaxID=6832 RepID=A0A553PPW9_TIGCA|nr:hypothetical protein TCAL_16114 [Tigriopus californicus]